MGDAESKAEKQLARDRFPLKCNILKAGHHGSRTSSSLQFLQFARPDIAIISVGARNRYRHPSRSVLERFIELGSDVLRSDLEGAVLFQGNGVRLEQIYWK